VPSSLAITISAFANSPGGGDLVLGLDERNGFAAVPVDALALAAAVASIARQALIPPIPVEINEVTFEGIQILIVRVPELSLSAKPSVVKRTGKGYLRSSDGDFELSEPEIQGILVNRTQPRFDNEPVATAHRPQHHTGL
jgi:ATP-dependent DNA helicase RecG